jgi:UDP-GlcNAc:undecaprenyl-phosphate/decaprenyl-phosphate GlcNAc-1-phosphate transferase
VREYVLVFLVSATVTFLVTPLTRRLAVRTGAMASPRDRDVHVIPTPRFGGIAMYAGLAAGLLVAGQLPFLSSVSRGYGAPRAVRIAGAIIWLETAVPVTVLLTVVLVNAMNFVDGLDGLAAGVAAIAALAEFAYSYHISVTNGLYRATPATLLAIATAGVCVGFLPHNFNPARQFMGDSGSMLIGLLLAATVTSVTGEVSYGGIAGANRLPSLIPLFVPLLVLAVPFVDLLLAVVRRTRARRSPFSPDKMHLHHRLLEIGHTQVRAVLLLWFWAALLGFGGVIAQFSSAPLTIVLIVTGLAGLSLVVVRMPGRAGR